MIDWSIGSRPNCVLGLSQQTQVHLIRQCFYQSCLPVCLQRRFPMEKASARGVEFRRGPQSGPVVWGTLVLRLKVLTVRYTTAGKFRDEVIESTFGKRDKSTDTIFYPLISRALSELNRRFSADNEKNEKNIDRNTKIGMIFAMVNAVAFC